MFSKYLLPGCGFSSFYEKYLWRLEGFNFKILMNSNLAIFFLYGLWFFCVSYLRKFCLRTHCLIQNHTDFLLFASRSHLVTFRFMIRFELIFVKDVKSVSRIFLFFYLILFIYYFFVCECLVVSALFLSFFFPNNFLQFILAMTSKRTWNFPPRHWFIYLFCILKSSVPCLYWLSIDHV